MRRQRTASESNEESPNDFNSRRRSESDENEEHHQEGSEEVSNDENMSDSEDSYETEYSEEDEDSEEEGDEEDYSGAHLDIMEQLQSAILSATGVNREDIEGFRRALSQNTGGLFTSIRGGATHSNRINSIIRSLPSNPQLTDPMMLYSAFTELWELIVLTGEEVEAYEFDMVVDLKPLLSHLLRVLKWDAECQIYGMEFLLYAVRCTRACVQYSPNCSRRLVESGLVPLIAQQLFSVEYIDLAEDLIQIIQLLTRNGTHSRACLHSDGIRAVLVFVDFFALPVQVNAFNAAAQMATALTDDTLHLYLPDDILALLRSTVRKIDASDQQVLKLSHWALRTLYNALLAAPKQATVLFPDEFLIENVLPLANILPVDSSLIVLKLSSISEAIRTVLLKDTSLILKFLKELLKNAASNETLLQNCLRIIIELFCQPAQKSLQELIPFWIKNFTVTSVVSSSNTLDSRIYNDLSSVIHEFYLESPSISQSLHHLIVLTMLLLDDVNAEKTVSLIKMGSISRLISDLKDPLSLIIGLEWCQVLCQGDSVEFSKTATRQGLLSELEPLIKVDVFKDVSDANLKNWLEDRLESMNVTVFSGDETEVLRIYVKHLSSELVNLLKASTDNAKLASSHLQKSVQEFLDFLQQNSQFTEFEWLGDPQNCLSRTLLNLIQKFPEQVAAIKPESFEPIVQAIYKALNRYESVFTANLPSIRLSRSTNSMESLALLSRPMRVIMRLPDNSEKMVICDPFSNISWLVKMAISSDEERKTLLRETTTENRENAPERIQDALTDSAGPSVNCSALAFESPEFKKLVFLAHEKLEVALEPSASLIEVLFKHVLPNDDPWKKINELWSRNVVIVIKEKGDEMDTTMDTEPLRNELVWDERVKLALDLLASLPNPMPNDQLSSKLTKELDSPLLVAVNGISSHWIRSAKTYPFLYSFPLRVSLMKTVCLGRLRSLWLLQQRLIPNGGDLVNGLITSSISLPRKRFRIHRTEFLKCLRHVFTPANCGDLRVFEFEYADELGTGHGPTMEFYALASTEICRPSLGMFHVTRPGNLEADELIEAEGEGLFPSWKQRRSEEFRILGSLIARAWLDDRIIDIPLHQLFISAIKGDLKRSLTFADLKTIDSDLYEILIDENKMIGCGINFNIPGSDVCLVADSERLICTSQDLDEYRNLLIEHVYNNLIEARDSFLQGFNGTFPQMFDRVAEFFPADLVYLFSPSLMVSTDDWTIESIVSALVPDHGYRPDSPQIRWLAELLVESSGDYRRRSKIIRFLTGAAYLPIGGWKALKPPLTIVCKTFDNDGANSSANNTGNNGFNNNTSTANTNNNLNTNTPNNLPTSPTSSSSSTISLENHDSYLPSVMTCANYLKLPRYTNKEIMRERLGYAVEEGGGAFHLS